MRKVVLAVVLLLVLTIGGGAMAKEVTYYTIEAGDTLRKIAAKYETTVLELLDFNPGITPDNLQIGEKVTLPVEPLWSYHIVQPGDNAKSLATQYQVPLEALKQANELKDNKLTEGKMIRIPIHFYLGEAKEISHKIEIGDTLYKIAQQYKVSLENLIKWNDIKDVDSIYAGQSIIVG
ncbi:MAG: LysM peptidoglycan-binding domain-containing protein [Bacillota bacterium]|nr:LysM peptidoglycan-binding domain-containing protein [Bacillota bacterium]